MEKCSNAIRGIPRPYFQNGVSRPPSVTISSGILRLMRSRMSRIAVTLVLLTCLVCPLVEMFDHWDHTFQTGNDSEYALVVLALCVGVAYTFARFILRISLRPSAAGGFSSSCACKPIRLILISSLSIVPIPISPPALALRI